MSLGALDLDVGLSEKKYERRLRELRTRLFELQRACWTGKLASVVVFEGWTASGKSDVIAKLTQRLDPRRFRLHGIRAPRTYETVMPWLWRYWLKLPKYGVLAILDRGWHRRVVTEPLLGGLEETGRERAFDDICRFERLLTDDRYVLVKLFLHLDRDELERRLERMRDDPATSWRVQEKDLDQLERYDQYLAANDEMLRRTDAAWAPWTPVAATDRYWVRVRAFETVIAALERGLERRGAPSVEGP